MNFRDYQKYAEEQFAKDRFGKYVWYAGQMLKKHEPAIWRPITWCDRCKTDIVNDFHFNEITGEALCSQCSGFDDKAEAAALGILWEA